MIHLDLPHDIAVGGRKRRNVAVEISMKPEIFCDKYPVSLKPAIHVVHGKSRCQARHSVGDAREKNLRSRIKTVVFPPAYKVRSPVKHLNKPRNFARVILQVAIKRYDILAGCLRKSCLKRLRFPEV